MANSNDVTVLDATPVVAIVKITSAHMLCPFVEVSLSMEFGYDEINSLLGRHSAHISGLRRENPDYRDYTSSGRETAGVAHV